MKTLAVLQPSYLPWLGYFDQIGRSDVFIFYDDVQYDKHGWRNRNRVKSGQGEPHWLTVPVLTKGLNKPLVNQVEINKAQDWVGKQTGTLKHFYSKAPFTKEYLPQLEQILTKPWQKLIDLDLEVIAWMNRCFSIETETHLSSQLGVEGEQSERLLKICKKFEATHYLSGSAARDYLDIEMFRKSGVEVVWQDYHHPVYSQLHGAFVPYLSAIDLVFNEGPNAKNFFGQNHSQKTLSPNAEASHQMQG